MPPPSHEQEFYYCNGRKHVRLVLEALAGETLCTNRRSEELDQVTEARISSANSVRAPLVARSGSAQVCEYFAYVPNNTDGRVSVIDTSNDAVVATILGS